MFQGENKFIFSLFRSDPDPVKMSRIRQAKNQRIRLIPDPHTCNLEDSFFCTDLIYSTEIYSISCLYVTLWQMYLYNFIILGKDINAANLKKIIESVGVDVDAAEVRFVK